jgi:hypothetical protein
MMTVSEKKLTVATERVCKMTQRYCVLVARPLTPCFINHTCSLPTVLEDEDIVTIVKKI